MHLWKFRTALILCSFLPNQLIKAYSKLYLVFSKNLTLILTMGPKYTSCAEVHPSWKVKSIVYLNHVQNLTFDLECAHIREYHHLQHMVLVFTSETGCTCIREKHYPFLTFIFIWSGYGILFLTSLISL